MEQETTLYPQTEPSPGFNTSACCHEILVCIHQAILPWNGRKQRLVAVSSCIVLVLFSILLCIHCVQSIAAFAGEATASGQRSARWWARWWKHQDPPTNQYESVLGGWWVGWIWLGGFGPEVYANLYLRQAKKYFKKICPPDKLAEFILFDFFLQIRHTPSICSFFLCKALWYNQRTRQTAKNERLSLSLSNPQRLKAQCSDAPVSYLKKMSYSYSYSYSML